MKITERVFTATELNIIGKIAEKTNLLPETAKVLYSRGVSSAEEAERFLNPSAKHFGNPFLLKGVSEAVRRVDTARDNGESVVIYGDYDADGICASTVLLRALKEYGVNATAIVPERENGYGLSESVIDEIAENLFPDLLITVDCGISCKNEVEYLKDIGIDVIVTDHHEIPEELPDCIVVNCKLKEQEYSFNGLCGAGVAYKLAYALLGEKANKYLDLVALATVADSMPLVLENRDIVYEGLNLIKSGQCSAAIKELVRVCGIKDINSSALAYGLAPRVNAAGRMGDAYSALRLFTTDDFSEIKSLTEKLAVYNVTRQQSGDELLKEAETMLETHGNYGKAIVLYGEGWNGGLLGIACAKIVEKYNVPAILFAENGGAYHGSARSVEGVNIYDAISACKEYLIDFGGHSQAAGVTISKENIEPFAESLNKYITENYDENAFEKVIETDGFISGKFSLKFAKELSLIEPCGTGNRKPLFAKTVNKAFAAPLKEGSKHVGFSCEGNEFTYFGGIDDLKLLNEDCEKTVLFEPNISYYNGKEYLKCFVRAVYADPYKSEKLYLRSVKKYFAVEKSGDVKSIKLNSEQARDMLANDKNAIFVLNNPKNADKFPGLKSREARISETDAARSGCVFVGCIPDGARGNNKIVFLDKPLFIPDRLKEASVYENDELPSFGAELFKADRTMFASLWKGISAEYEKGSDVLGRTYLILKNFYSAEEFLFAAAVFKELGFIKEDDVTGRFTIDCSARRPLTDSVLFRKFSSR